MPAAWNHSAMSRFSAAAPEMKNRTRPPKRSRILENTSRSNSACWSFSGSGTDLPSRLSLSTFRPTANAALKIFSFAPPSAACIVTMRPWAFSKMRGAAPMKVGFTTARLSMILSTRPSTAVAKPQASWVESSTLPNECAIGSQRNWTSSSLEDLLGLDGRTLVGPRRVAQPHALGLAGRARGVDQRRELVGLDGVDRLRHRVGVLGEVLLTERAEVVEADHPVAVGRRRRRAPPCRGGAARSGAP